MVRYAAASFSVALALCTADSARADDRAEKPFRVSESAVFFRPRVALERFVAASHARNADLCVVAYPGRAGGAPHAWIVWPGRRALVLWEPTADHTDNLMLSRRWLDLDRDVVATDDDVAGSTYLVTRAWVDQTVADCNQYGERFRVRVNAQLAAPSPRRR